jgi:hypothetical protein
MSRERHELDMLEDDPEDLVPVEPEEDEEGDVW